jgi:methyl-branched lipid omega-hydroxylase
MMVSSGGTRKLHGLTVEDVNLSDPAFWEGPREDRFPAFDLLRRERPIAWQPAPLAWAPPEYPPPNGYWAITRYEHVRMISRHPKAFVSGLGTTIFDNLPASVQYAIDGWVGLDAPHHTELRRVVSGLFAPRAVRRMGLAVRTAARHSIGKVAAHGSCDFFRDIADPFPADVICELLGVPEGDRAQLLRLSHDGGHFGNEPGSFGSSLAANRAVGDYAIGLAAERRRHPQEDLMTALVCGEINGVAMSEEDLVAGFWTILTGGTDTTGAAATHALLALQDFPEERDRLRYEFDAVADLAVEEILRWGSPLLNFRRTAALATSIDGVEIREGDNLVLFYLSANRDESVFEDPYRFDLKRAPNPHLAFGGGGPHTCLGAALSRLELRVLFRELFSLLPDIHVDGQPLHSPSPLLDAITCLPCAFSPTDPQRWEDN